MGPILGGTLLGSIQDKVRSELNVGPPDQPFTNIKVGTTPPPAPPPSTPLPFLPGFEPRVDVNPRSEPIKRRLYDGYATGSNDQPIDNIYMDQPKISVEEKPKPKLKLKKVQSPGPDGQLSFSELMSDFFINKPLPFKAAQKSRHLDGKSPPHG